MGCACLRRHRRHRQTKMEGSRKISNKKPILTASQAKNLNVPEMRIRPGGASFAIPVYFRPQLESGKNLHLRAAPGPCSTVAAAGGDAGAVGVANEINFGSSDVEYDFSLKKESQSLGKKNYTPRTSTQKVISTESKRNRPSDIGKPSDQNPSRLLVGPPDNCSSMTGELLVYALNLSGGSDEEVGFVINDDTRKVLPPSLAQSSSPQRLQAANTSLQRTKQSPKVIRTTLVPNKPSDPTNSRHLRPFNMKLRPPGLITSPKQPAHFRSSQNSSLLPSAAPVSRSSTADQTSPEKIKLDGLSVRNRGPSRRARSVSPDAGSQDRKNQSVKWKSSPRKQQEQGTGRTCRQANHQKPTSSGNIPSLHNKPRSELVESAGRWAGGLTKQRINKIRQKTKQAENKLFEKANRFGVIGPPERQKPATKFATGGLLITDSGNVRPKRDTLPYVKRRENKAHPTITTINLNSQFSKKGGSNRDDRRDKTNTAIVCDGRPRFKTDWSALFTSLAAKRPKKKKGKITKRNTKLNNTDFTTEECSKLVTMKPGLPIKPVASPGNRSGKMFGLRKTVTPILSSLSGQGAFTTYMRSDRVAVDDRNLSNKSNEEILLKEQDHDVPGQHTSVESSGNCFARGRKDGCELLGNQARHNTRFLSTSATEPTSSSNECSFFAEAGGHTTALKKQWIFPHNFKNDQNFTANVSISNKRGLSKGDCIQLKAQEQGKVPCEEQKFLCNKMESMNEVSHRERNKHGIGCFADESFAMPSKILKNIPESSKVPNHSIDLSSRGTKVQHCFKRSRAISHSQCPSQPKRTSEDVRQASPLQFEMPMQEPLLSDIVQTLHPALKSRGTACGKKSGMGAYLQFANKLHQKSKVFKEHTGKNSASVSKNASPANCTSKGSMRLKGNTVFRITKNRVTTLKPPKGQISTWPDETVPQRRGNSFRHQVRSTVDGSKKDSNPLESMYLTPNNPQVIDSIVKEDDLLPKDHPERKPVNKFHVRRTDYVCRDTFWQTPSRHTNTSREVRNDTIPPNKNENEGGFSVGSGNQSAAFLRLKSTDQDETNLKNNKSSGAGQEPQNMVVNSILNTYNQCTQRQGPLNMSQLDTHIDGRSCLYTDKENLTEISPQSEKNERGTVNPRKNFNFEYFANISNSSKSPMTDSGELTFESISNIASSKSLSPKERKRHIKTSKSLLSVSNMSTKLRNYALKSAKLLSPQRCHLYTKKSQSSCGKGTTVLKVVPKYERIVPERMGKAYAKKSYKRSPARLSSSEKRPIPGNPVGSSSGSRVGSERERYIRYYKMKKMRVLRHEPYQKATLTKNSSVQSIPRTHRLYQARNRNNCSPLRKCHIAGYQPVLGKIFQTGRGVSCSSDSLSLQSDSRNRQSHEWLCMMAQSAKSQDYATESDVESEVFTITASKKEASLSNHRASTLCKPHDPERTPVIKNIIPTKIRPVSLPPRTLNSANTSRWVTNDSDTRLKPGQHKPDGEDSGLCQSKAAKKAIQEKIAPIKTVKEYEKLCSPPSTKSHMTQTEMSGLTSQCVAIQTSPGAIVNDRKRPPTRHRCRSSYLIQELIKHRAKEMRLDRAARHKRKSSHVRKNPFTEQWVFHQNNNKDDIVARQTFTFDAFQTTRTSSNAFFDAKSFLPSPCKDTQRTVETIDQSNARLNPVEDKAPGDTFITSESLKAGKHQNSDISASELAENSNKEANNDIHYNAGDPLWSNDRTIVHYLPKVSTPQACSKYNTAQIKESAHIEGAYQKQKTSPKFADLHKMCVVRPSWKNANIEEVDRRVKRALRLRHELQRSRTSVGCCGAIKFTTTLGSASLNSSPPDEQNVISKSSRNEGSGCIIKGDFSQLSSHDSQVEIENRFINYDEELQACPREAGEFSTDKMHKTDKDNVDDTNHDNDTSLTREEITKTDTTVESVIPFINSMPEHQQSSVIWDRSMSALDLACSQPGKGMTPEQRSSSVDIVSMNNQRENNSLFYKRGITSDMSRSSAPSKIPNIEETSSSETNPRLVGSLVRCLPQVPLSSFVEWFIETSDPKTFLSAEQSKTLLHVDSKPLPYKKINGGHTGDDAISNFTRSSVSYCRTPERFRQTLSVEKTVSEESSAATPTNTIEVHPGIYMEKRDVYNLGLKKPLSQVTADRNHIISSDTKTHYISHNFKKWKSSRFRLRERKDTPKKKSILTLSSSSGSTTSSAFQSQAHNCIGNESEAGLNSSPFNVKTSSNSILDRENTQASSPPLHDCDENSPNTNESIDTNKLYLKAPLRSTFSDGSYEDDCTIDDAVSEEGSEENQNMKYHADHNTNLNLSYIDTCLPQGKRCSGGLDTKLIETGQAIDRTRAHVSQDVTSSDIPNAKHVRGESCSLNDAAYQNHDERCAPGIRHILMKLKQSDETVGSKANKTQPESVRITLRRSADVSGIIAKFQDKNDKEKD